MKLWRGASLISAAALALFAPAAMMPAAAAVRASLDRDHIAPGQSITLTLTADGNAGQPDLSPLRKDFDVSGVASGSQMSIINGNVRSSLQWSVTMAPKHAGLIDIPPLQVGNERSAPLRVLVDAAGATGAPQAQASPDPSAPDVATRGPGKPGDPAFIENSVSTNNPYVGQALLYTLRLFYAINPVNASLSLPDADNGDLRQIGPDQNGMQVIQGRTYRVLERHYLLQPEHSGALHIPAPAFQAQTMPGMIDPFADDMDMGGVSAQGKALDLSVRPRPAAAADPWLPARSLRLSVDPPGAAPRAGEPFSVVVHEDGVGVSAAQLPEIVLPTIAGAQVYPEPSTTRQSVDGGELHAQRSRRFAIVPAQAGALRLPEITLPWWDVGADRAAVARLALPTLHVEAGAASAAASGTPSAATAASAANGTAAAAPAASLQHWQIATAALGVLCLLALVWGWWRGVGGRGQAVPAGEPLPVSPAASPRLAEALASGDAAQIARALCEAAPGPRSTQLAQIAQRLADPEQRRAVLDFEATRWQGDGKASPAALAALHVAFAGGARWAAAPASAATPDPLPPLYPD